MGACHLLLIKNFSVQYIHFIKFDNKGRAFKFERNEKMEGGNGVREANGITQFANGEPKRKKRI